VNQRSVDQRRSRKSISLGISKHTAAAMTDTHALYRG
jgi:hypothetical protein